MARRDAGISPFQHVTGPVRVLRKEELMLVFVLDRHKRPLMPCSEKRARLLLERGRAVIHRIEPFTIRLKDRTVTKSSFQPLRLKLDPGAKTTGAAVLREKSENEAVVIWLAEIHHKTGIKESIDKRRAVRRSRRSRKTRYRQPRFDNRRRPEGWLPPSLQARVNQTINAVKKLRSLLPLTAISVEHVKFDTQLLQNPEIKGVEYQRGELFGYEVKEYLLENGVVSVPTAVGRMSLWKSSISFLDREVERTEYRI